jgi:L-asparaginase type II
MPTIFWKWISLCLLVLCAAGAAQAQDLPRVAILATGGTIAGAGASATNTTEYKAGALDVGVLLAAAPGLDKVARLTSKQVLSIDSANIVKDDLVKIATAVNDAVKDSSVDGVVLTHGTDTMEETAYLLHLLVKTSKPIVLTGSMRPATALSPDGPLNLYNAVALAASREAQGKGALIAMNETVHSARHATKTHATSVETFQSPGGVLGYIQNGKPVLPNLLTKRHTAQSEFSLETLANIPRVDILYGHGDDTGDLVEAAVKAGAKGIIHAGVGDGGIHPRTHAALRAARKQGVLVVRASRVGAGCVAPSAEDKEDDFLSADTLNPQKARILLQLALATTGDPRLIRRMFREY